MIRKTLLAIVLAITGIITATAGQHAGDWYKYPLYTDKIDKIIETSDKVYFLSGISLFSFSPADNETYCYSALNKLSDNTISDIYYNHEKKYLVVVYDNGNLDLLFDDGRVVNMPDIKDSPISGSTAINDIAFGEGVMAVATDFGIVIYNDDRYEVIESGIYNQPISRVALMHDHILIWGERTTSYGIFVSPLKERHNNLDKFKRVGGYALVNMIPVDDDILAFNDSEGNLQLRRINFTDHYWTLVPNDNPSPSKSRLVRFKDGVFSVSPTHLVVIKGAEVTAKQLPEPLQGELIALYDDTDKVWSANADGIARFDISSATPTVLYDRMLPADIITDKRVGYMRWSADGRRLYISNMENSVMRNYAAGEGSTNYQTTNIITKDGIVDASIKKASATHPVSQKMQNRYGSTRMFGDPTWMLEDAYDPDKYYIGNYFEGIYIAKKNNETGAYEEVGKFTTENTSIPADEWAMRVTYLDYDKEGNLWVGCQNPGFFTVLPADKLRQDPSTITKDDWRNYTILAEDYASKDLTALLCKRSDMVFFFCAKYERGFAAIDTKGTYTDPSDDTAFYWNKIIDQDGNDVTYHYITFLVEDHRGCVWVGTSAGIFEITNPSNATNPSMTMRRIKVPRNDGTNYADYLLDSEFINWIAVDPADRKWVCTENSGIYLVSETGDAILAHYDTSNSPLPSNSVWSIECDKTDNTVYVGTPNGLYSFKTDAAAAHTDYNDIYAYPNPVRPEYSGLVTITGLMDNSTVKIADAAGNVMAEMKSEGGMATWDACNRAGQRVRSGVYYVYASQSNSGTTSGAVTKILVIN